MKSSGTKLKMIMIITESSFFNKFNYFIEKLPYLYIYVIDQMLFFLFMNYSNVCCFLSFK